MTATVFLVALDVAVVGVFGALTVSGIRDRHRPGAVSAALLWFGLTGVAVSLTMGHAAIIPARATLYAVGIGWFGLVPLWTAFVFEYTGRGPSVTGRFSGFAALYVIGSMAVTRLSGDLGRPVGSVLRVIASLSQTVIIGAGLFAVFIIVRSAVADDDISRPQAIGLALGGTGTSLLLFSITGVAAEPVTLPAVSSGFLGVTAGGFALAVFRYRLFSDTPGMGFLARRSVLEQISEAVIVVDRQGRLVDANAAAEQVLGVTLAADAGRPAARVLGHDPDSLVTDSPTVATPTGQRQFEVGRSVLKDARGDTVGESYLFQDVTSDRTRKQRLTVFNRVFRHNLRNDLDAIRAFAEALTDDAVDDDGVAARMRGTARKLAELGETVEDAERIIAQDSLQLEAVDPVAVVEAVSEGVSDRYDCRILTPTSGGDRTVTTDQSLLQIALKEVVENAVEHTDSENPTVSIDIEWKDSSVRIAVSDEGPGIPDREREILLDGEETPLQHGTSVGLWLVSWAVARLGGDLSLGDSDRSGGEVTLTVPSRAERHDEYPVGDGMVG